MLMTLMVLAANADTLSLNAENDLFAPKNTDKFYTHGTRISYLDSTTNSWLKLDNALLFGEKDAIEYSVGQYMYTPDDISMTELQEQDRPYAGILYGELAHIKYDERQYSRIGYLAGIIGEESYAEETQTFIHGLSGNQKPMGWDNQISTEPILNLQYVYKYRLINSKWYDVIPRVEGALGNAHIFGGLGLDLRLGYNMRTWGYSIMEPVPRENDAISCYVLAGTCGRLVARNITLDGNTFKDSHSVDREEEVADFHVGCGLRYKRISLEYRLTYRTDEFEEQDKQTKFGSIALRIDV